MKLGIALLLCLAVGGCASPRLYPVCFYNQQPSEEVFERYYLPRLKEVLEGILGAGRSAGVLGSPDGRWLIASATNPENEQIAKVWPRIGCIGQALNSNEVDQERQCALYVDAFTQTNNYLAFGNAKDQGGIDVWNEAPDNHSIVFCHQVRIQEAVR